MPKYFDAYIVCSIRCYLLSLSHPLYNLLHFKQNIKERHSGMGNYKILSPSNLRHSQWLILILDSYNVWLCVMLAPSIKSKCEVAVQNIAFCFEKEQRKGWVE
jgi:hypothetical protein